MKAWGWSIAAARTSQDLAKRPRFAYPREYLGMLVGHTEGICRYAPVMYSAIQMQSVAPAVREEASLSEGGFLVCLAQ